MSEKEPWKQFYDQCVKERKINEKEPWERCYKYKIGIAIKSDDNSVIIDRAHKIQENEDLSPEVRQMAERLTEGDDEEWESLEERAKEWAETAAETIAMIYKADFTREGRNYEGALIGSLRIREKEMTELLQECIFDEKIARLLTSAREHGPEWFENFTRELHPCDDIGYIEFYQIPDHLVQVSDS